MWQIVPCKGFASIFNCPHSYFGRGWGIKEKDYDLFYFHHFDIKSMSAGATLRFEELYIEDKLYKHKRTLTAHIKSVHNAVNLKKFICELCNKVGHISFTLFIANYKIWSEN